MIAHFIGGVSFVLTILGNFISLTGHKQITNHFCFQKYVFLGKSQITFLRIDYLKITPLFLKTSCYPHFYSRDKEKMGVS